MFQDSTLVAYESTTLSCLLKYYSLLAGSLQIAHRTTRMKTLLGLIWIPRVTIGDLAKQE